MTSVGRGALVALMTILVAARPAHAHLMTTGFGPFYDGLTHLLVSPEYLLPMIALALFAGLHGPRAGRALLFALPAARLAGCLNGTELATTRSSPLAAAGAAAALFVAVSLVTGQIASLRAAWARIAVQVAGSWIAAIGLFVLGWAVRGR